MSNSNSGKKPNSESLADRFRKSLTTTTGSGSGGDKPDTREGILPARGASSSPVSSSRPRDSHGVPIPPSTSSSSSSSSSGSVTIGGRTTTTPSPKTPSSSSSSASKSRTTATPPPKTTTPPPKTTTIHSADRLGSKESSSRNAGGRSTASTPPPPGRDHLTKSSPRSSPLSRSGASGRGGSSSSSGRGSGSPTATQPFVHGNIFPSGHVPLDLMIQQPQRSTVLRQGPPRDYGYGSIMRGKGAPPGGGGDVPRAETKRATANSDLELRNLGNKSYKKGNFVEALGLYDQAISISPNNATHRYNRAAALIGLKRLHEAVRECEEAVRLDPGYQWARQRLGSLYLRLGHVENARRQLCTPGQLPVPDELQKLQTVEEHLRKCVNAKRDGDWRGILKQCDDAIAAGVDSSPHFIACRAEALLKLFRLDDAKVALESIPDLGPSPPSCSQTRFFGMLTESYVSFVRAQIEMTLGRFDNAVAAVDKARQIDSQNVQIAQLQKSVNSVVEARNGGNALFMLGKFSEALSVYGDGLKHDPTNPVLYHNRASCWSKLGKWESCREDCNKALFMQPNYTKALRQRATSNGMLERWANSVNDYEVLSSKCPDDRDVAEALFHAKIALKKSRGEETQNFNFFGKVEEFTDLHQLTAAMSSTGTTVVFFKASENKECKDISPFVDRLCLRYPCVKFLRVDVQENVQIAKNENVRRVPVFKIYNGGSSVREMICPERHVLQLALIRYGL